MWPRMRQSAVDALRWSERYTKTDMVYLAKGSFWIVFGQIVTTLLSFVLLYVFANYLPKETYGVYRYILSLAAVLNVFTLTGMNQAVAQAVATGNDGAFRASVSYQLKWNLLMLAAFWALGTYYFVNGNSTLGTAFVILGATMPFTAAFNTYGAYLDSKRQFLWNNVFSVFSTVVYVGGMIAAVFLSGEAVWLVTAYAAATFLSTLFFYIVTVRMFRPPSEPSHGALRFGRQLTFIGFIGPIVDQIDKVILVQFWGPAQLANYALASAIPDRLVPFAKGWVNVGFPKLAARTAAEINALLYVRISQGVVVGAVLALGYWLIVPYIFVHFLPKYVDVTLFSQILGLTFIFAIPNRFVSMLLETRRIPRVLFFNSLLQNGVRVLLYIMLGIWGGILGLVIAQIANSLLGLIISIVTWRLAARSS